MMSIINLANGRIATILVAVSLLGGCAATGEWGDPRDPFESFNRAIYTFNDTLDNTLVKPVAIMYTALPDPVETGISNVFSNLNDISVTLNDLFQFKLSQASSDAGRFLVNTTIGIFGIFDFATDFGMPKHNEDFGQTLGAWGVPDGPYLVLPVFGPQNLRDAVALIPEIYLDPVAYIEDDSTRLGVQVLRGVDRRAGLLGASRVVDQAALDPYDFVRDGYFQRREYLIYDGNPPDSFDDEFDAAP